MSMPVDGIRDELDTFTLSSLERAALTEAVVRLQGIQESSISYLLHNDPSTIPAYSDGDEDTSIEDDYIGIDAVGPYEQDILHWQDWKPDSSVATLSGPAERRPLLQRKDSTVQTFLYEFKLTRDHVLTISTPQEKVEAAWHELAELYKLQRDKAKDFKLTDIFCFLQVDDKILTSIPAEEVAALKECIRNLATYAVQRLEHPTFILLRERSPVLQYELNIFTLCLRKEIEEQSEMLIRFWFEDGYHWIEGQMFQIMATETQTSVDLIIIHKREKKHTRPKYQILYDISELNTQGVFFRCQGLGLCYVLGRAQLAQLFRWTYHQLILPSMTTHYANAVWKGEQSQVGI
ncbi:hypothetical protein LTR93_011290 [Exophiala xenobiotica]|nr:hypothetical protein LTR93_011290 [Exophiala xenobiotica]